MSARIILTLLAILCFSGCGSRDTNSEHTSNEGRETCWLILRGSRNNTVSDVGMIEYDKYGDSVSITYRGALHSQFEQKVEKDGLYRKVGDQYIISHSFTQKGKLIYFPVVKPPFMNRITRLVGDTTLHIEGENFEVLVFDEYSSPHDGPTTFYLKGKGFIGFYSEDEHNSVVCSRSTDTALSREVLEALRAFMDKDFNSRWRD